MLRSTRLRALAATATAALGLGAYAVFAGAATPIPVPDAVVIVTTKSGNFTRQTPVPIGGAPVPIDVTGPSVTGLLEPDIDVSVGLVALDELPEKPLVPNVVVRRNALALTTGRPAPPLELDAKIVLRDAAAAMRQLVEIHYGFATPEGARIPSVITAKLVGPVLGGFVDPLRAKIESPGYSGPLDINLSALTDDLDAKFDLDFDSLPESIFITEDPREDGLDVSYDHIAPVADVHLDARATLKKRGSDEALTIATDIERLPRHIELHDTTSRAGTHVEYVSSSALSKPDVEATYSDSSGMEAAVKVAGLPFHMTGDFATVRRDDKTRDLDKVDFRVLDGEEIDSVDFDAGNADLPIQQLGPEQFVAVATRGQSFRAAGHISGIRRATVERTGENDETLTADTDLGDGTKPLRALLDLDDRAKQDGKRIALDTTITPLPRTIHTEFTAGDPTTVSYQSSARVDIDATATVAGGPADDCGELKVTCLTARVDKVPAKLDLELPGETGKAFRVGHSGAGDTRPDVRATLHTTDAFVDVGLLRVPPQVAGWLDSGKDGVLRSAEFHGCHYDFGDQECDDEQGAIGRVNFTVRDRPTRQGLPPRPDTAPTFVALVNRDEHFEVAGRVDEVRNVAFHQLDRTEGDGKADGVLGVLVDVGSGGAFDAVVDDVEGAKSTDVKVNVASLPSKFTACVRQTGESAPPNPDDLPKDALLKPCERNDVVTPAEGEHEVTPLAAHYSASQPTKVTATVRKTEPDAEDGNAPATQLLDLTIDKVPGELRADVIPPIAPKTGVAGRKLQLAYNASAHIDSIKFGLESRRANSICEDPRPNRRALCLEGTLKDLPAGVSATYDPDDSKGDIEFKTSAPAEGKPKPSIAPFRLSKVAPGAAPLVLEASITGLSRHLKGVVRKLELDGENVPATPPLADALATCGNTTDDDGDGKADAKDPDCDPQPAELSFDACPGSDPCAGIEKIAFTASNSLVGDPLPAVPAADPPVAGLEQEFSFMQVGDDFRAKGVVNNLRELAYAKVDDKGKASRKTTLRAAFGNGTPLRAFVSRETGTETQKLDGIITDAPEAITICMRDRTNAADLSNATFCDQADASKLALQATLDTPADTVKPDVDLRTIELSKGGGAETLTGNVKIADLTERVDVLVGRGKDTDILVEGRELDGDLADVAQRVTFGIRNFRGAEGNSFPWKPLDGGTDPEHDARNDGNYVRVVKDADGALLAKGSVPNVKRLQLQPGPCEDDGRFPSAGFLDNQRPDYKCVRAIVAPGKPLGLAVRNLDANGEILSVEEGHISKVPDELAATIAKAPDTIKLAPICAADGPRPCRPPMISVKAPGADGTLDARLAVGDRNLNSRLALRRPDDPLSQRLNFEEAPRSGAFPKGARVKVGTEGSNLAIRAGLKVDLPKFLDLDPPTLYDCNHANKTPGPECQAGAKKESNSGYESKDIFFRLVAADDKPLGNPTAEHKYLGRVALMVEPFGDKTQIVITGMPAPDDHDPLTDRPARGASSAFAEDFPDVGDPSEKGFLAPAHLDAQVYLRNDFNAVKDGRNQVDYTQIDGRVNAPLSMAVRLNERPPLSAQGLLRYVPPKNRAGVRVPPTQLTIRNAPSSNNADDYAKPTFRVRAELRDTFKEVSNPGLVEKIFTCDGEGYGIQIPALLTFCALVPVNSHLRYLDVQLNADPYSDGQTTTEGAARTVEAVAGPFGASNNADMRGWRQVDGTGGPFGKGEPANITPVAALRLTNFNLGLKAGAGIGLIGASTTLEMLGDLVVGMVGHASDRTRLSSNIAALQIASEGGSDPDDFARVITNLQAKMNFKITGELLFGLVSEDLIDATTPQFHQPLEFMGCSPTGVLGIEFPSFDEFWTGQGNNFLFTEAKPGSRKAAIGMAVPPSFAGQANAFNLAVSQLLQPFWCVAGTSDDALVDATHPAPGYTNDDRLIPGQTGESNSETNVPEGQTPGDAPDFAVASGQTKVLCGAYTFDEVIVDGVLAVGHEGQQDVNNRNCDGKLELNARTVNVGGVLEADGARVAGPGMPGSGLGGGAGHAGSGGRSGKDRVTAGAGPGGGSYDGDVGSRGRGGDGVSGGAGGGVVKIAASDRIVVSGRISANGDPGEAVGAASGGACLTGGGGGSGGAVELTANLLGGSGSVQVRGGDGGTGGFGGGGGSAGRLKLDSVVTSLPRSVAGGGGAGTDTGHCDAPANANPRRAGTAGANGSITGQNLVRAANAQLHPDTPGPLASGDVKVSLVGFDQSAGPLELVLCRRSVGWDASDPFQDPGLDPAGNGSSGQLRAGATCEARGFSGPSTGSHEYRANVTLDLGTAVHGFFAYARKPHCSNGGIYQPTQSGGICVGGATGGSLLTFEDQTVLPAKKSAVVGVDKVLPDGSPIVARNGSGSCPGDSLCLAANGGEIEVTPQDGHSGVAATECSINDSAQWFDCSARPTTLTLAAKGLSVIDVRVVDRAGNQRLYDDAVKWFVDGTRPKKPTVFVQYVDGETNGWHREKPNVSVVGYDENPTSGFPAGAMTLFVDQGAVTCGPERPGNAATTGESAYSCSSDELAHAIPSDGVHVLTAQLSGRFDQVSDVSEAKTIRLDTTRPTSRLFVGPKLPDDGWHRSKPFIAFAGSDSAGGSGVDKIHVRINDGDWKVYDAEAANELPDGTNKVCWYAVDLAGNREDENCRTGIKVDSIAPVATAPIEPAGPNGLNGWYLSKPQVVPGATDAGGSGLDRVQVQVDDGAWTTVTESAPVVVDEGRHAVRVRAFDVAGNAAAVVERFVQVDASLPTGRLQAFPPTPNAHGWYRKTVTDSVSVRDGRDASGADGASVVIDGAPPVPYFAPLEIGEGVHSVSVTPRDRAGLAGAALSASQRVDVKPPTASATGASGSVILSGLLPQTAKLRFTAGDDLSSNVRVVVNVYDELGRVVRRLPATGPHLDGYRDTGSGHVVWNGRREDGSSVLAGSYHYRVLVVDQAGNTVLAPESSPFLVLLGTGGLLG